MQGRCKATSRGPQRGGATQPQQLHGQQSVVPSGMPDGLRPIGWLKWVAHTVNMISKVGIGTG